MLPSACSGPLESSSLAPRPSTLAPPCSPTSLLHQSLLSEQCPMLETPRDRGFGGYECRPREPAFRSGVEWAASLSGATTRSDVRKTCVTRPLRQGHVLRHSSPRLLPGRPVMLAVWQPQRGSWPLPSQPTTKVRPCRASRRAQFQVTARTPPALRRPMSPSFQWWRRALPGFSLRVPSALQGCPSDPRQRPCCELLSTPGWRRPQSTSCLSILHVPPGSQMQGVIASGSLWPWREQVAVGSRQC